MRRRGSLDLAVTQLAQFSLTLTDTVLIGRVGGDALAAVVGSTLYIVAYLLCMGILALCRPSPQAHGPEPTTDAPDCAARPLDRHVIGSLSILALWPAEQIFLLLDKLATSLPYPGIRARCRMGIIPGLCVIYLRVHLRYGRALFSSLCCVASWLALSPTTR